MSKLSLAFALTAGLALAVSACKNEPDGAAAGHAKAVKPAGPSGETPIDPATTATPAVPAAPVAPGTSPAPAAGTTPSPGTSPTGAAPSPATGALSALELEAFAQSVDDAEANLGDVESEDAPPAVAGNLQVEGAGLVDSGLLPLLGNVHGRLVSYTEFNKSMLAFVVRAIKGAKPLLKIAAAAGASSGSVDLGAAPLSILSRLDYEIVSAKAFKIVGHREGAPMFALEVTDKTYAIVMNAANLPLRSEAEGVSYAMTLTFASKSAWTLDSRRTVVSCEAATPGLPDASIGRIVRDGGVWRGRFSSIYKRKLESLAGTGCSEAAADRVAYYTDFVGDASGTTIALYIVPGNAVVGHDLSAYTLSKVCTNFPGACSALSFADKAVMTALVKNPICLKKQALPMLGAACAGGDAAVTNGDFGAAAAAKTPSELEALESPSL